MKTCKNIASLFLTAAFALSFMALAAGCGDGSGRLDGNDTGDGIPSELAGSWYNKDCDLAFEITEAGDGYIAAKKLYCTVTVSGNSVFFRQNDISSSGSFHYSIKNGEMTMSSGTGEFKDMSSSSPFIKAGDKPSDSNVPVELIGRWYTKTNPPLSPNFEITRLDTMIIQDDPTVYTVEVSGNTVFILNNISLIAKFEYFLLYGEMYISNGTEKYGQGMQVRSPYTKNNKQKLN